MAKIAKWVRAYRIGQRLSLHPAPNDGLMTNPRASEAQPHRDVDYDGRAIPVDTGFIVFNVQISKSIGNVLPTGRDHKASDMYLCRLESGTVAGMGARTGLRHRPDAAICWRPKFVFLGAK